MKIQIWKFPHFDPNTGNERKESEQKEKTKLIAIN